jgi:nickel-dependent lactate racemase
MIVELAYARDVLAVRLPEDCAVSVLRKRPMPPLADPEGAVRAAYAGPVAAPELASIARGRSSACILICDITRPVPNGLILPPLVRALLDAGIEPRAITVLVATGLPCAWRTTSHATMPATSISGAPRPGARP